MMSTKSLSRIFINSNLPTYSNIYMKVQTMYHKQTFKTKYYKQLVIALFLRVTCEFGMTSLFVVRNLYALRWWNPAMLILARVAVSNACHCFTLGSWLLKLVRDSCYTLGMHNMDTRCSLNISAHHLWESWELGRGLSNSQTELMSPRPICGDSVMNLLIETSCLGIGRTGLSSLYHHVTASPTGIALGKGLLCSNSKPHKRRELKAVSLLIQVL